LPKTVRFAKSPEAFFIGMSQAGAKDTRLLDYLCFVLLLCIGQSDWKKNALKFWNELKITKD
jgi:hypothetical protein